MAAVTDRLWQRSRCWRAEVSSRVLVGLGLAVVVCGSASGHSQDAAVYLLRVTLGDEQGFAVILQPGSTSVQVHHLGPIPGEYSLQSWLLRSDGTALQPGRAGARPVSDPTWGAPVRVYPFEPAVGSSLSALVCAFGGGLGGIYVHPISADGAGGEAASDEWVDLARVPLGRPGELRWPLGAPEPDDPQELRLLPRRDALGVELAGPLAASSDVMPAQVWMLRRDGTALRRLGEFIDVPGSSELARRRTATFEPAGLEDLVAIIVRLGERFLIYRMRLAA